MSTDSPVAPVVAELSAQSPPPAPVAGKAPSKRRRHATREGLGYAPFRRMLKSCGIQRKSKEVLEQTIPAISERIVKDIFDRSSFYTEVGGNKVVTHKDVAAGLGLRIGDF